MNEVAIYAPTAGLPTTEAHKTKLRAMWDAIKDGSRIDEHTRLLPVPVLQGMSRELAQAVMPTAPENASKWARILVNSFPAKDSFRDADHAKVFSRSLAYDLAEFPQDIVERTVHETRRTGGAFIPGAGEIYRRAKAMLEDRKAMAAVVERQLAEHRRRQEDAEKPKPKKYDDMTEDEKKEFDGRINRLSEILKQPVKKIPGAENDGH